MSNFPSNTDELKDNTTSVLSVTVSFKDYLEYQVAVIIWKTCPPCILLLGGFGNIATICVMRRIKDHNSSQHAILMALAVSDITLLCTIMPHYWIHYVFQVEILNLHVAICKLRPFFVYVSGITSAWLVTCVTVQRAMAVLWPHRMRVMCTVRRTWIVIATLVVSMCTLYSHILIGFGITGSEGCSVTKGMYQQFYDYYFSLIDLCMASFLPAACMIVCDIILSVSLFKAAAASSSLAVESNVNTAHSTDIRKKTFYRTTIMVLAISCAFLVLTLPLLVSIVWYSYNTAENPKDEARDVLVQTVTRQLFFTNGAINFFLYCLTGTKFRREFLHWIRCCGAQNPSAPSVHEKASETSREGRHQHHGNSPLSK